MRPLRDRAAMLAMRGIIALQPDAPLTPDGRSAADEMLEKTPAAAGVRYEAGAVGGVPGWWCVPDRAHEDAAILYLHGGAYVVGSAAGYRHFVSQIASRARLAAFVPDYALAPERPFRRRSTMPGPPFRGLVATGRRQIFLVGDSAGGGLTLAPPRSSDPRRGGGDVDQAAGRDVMSPWIDLALGGESVETRAKTDPLLTREKLAQAAKLYLQDGDPRDPRVSALSASVAQLPPVQVHVGADKILLDDSVRYAEALERSGGWVDLHIWKGMTHVFPSGVATLAAAGEALDIIGAFIEAHLHRAPSATGGL